MASTKDVVSHSTVHSTMTQNLLSFIKDINHGDVLELFSANSLTSVALLYKHEVNVNTGILMKLRIHVPEFRQISSSNCT